MSPPERTRKLHQEVSNESLSKLRTENPVKKTSRMENDLRDFLEPGNKWGSAQPPKSPNTDEDSGSDYTPSSPESTTIKKSTRLCRSQAQKRKRLEEERYDREEAAAWKSLKKPMHSKNELFKIACGRRLQELPLVTDKYPPRHGEFGTYIGYIGGNYVYNQMKRVHEAQREFVLLEETEPEYDSATDVDEDLPEPGQRRPGTAASKRKALTFELR
jgi:hypothetical protein